MRPLTFTRFIAASLVVAFHYGKQAAPFREAPLMLDLGSVMVSYFFVLSGFILTSVYAPAAHADGTIDAWRFWQARGSRIMPVYLLAVALVWLLNRDSFFDTASLLLSVSLLQAWIPRYPASGNAPGWSLSVEAFFYLLFPVLLASMLRMRLRLAVVMTGVFWGVSQAVHLGLRTWWYDGFPSRSHDLIYYFPPLHLSEFLLGMVAALAYRKGHGVVHSPRVALLVAAVVLAMLALLVAAGPVLTQMLGITVSYTNGLLAPIFLLLVFALASPHCRFLSHGLGHPWLVRLGEMSYALYLLQIPVFIVYQHFIRPRVEGGETLRFWSFFFLLNCVALVTYRYVEHPMRRLLRAKPRSALAGIAGEEARERLYPL